MSPKHYVKQLPTTKLNFWTVKSASSLLSSFWDKVDRKRRGTLSLHNFTQQVFKNHNCNPFKSSTSLSIHVSFCIFCAIYSYLKCYERQLFLYFNQFDGSSLCSECWQISWYLLQANNGTVFPYYLISQRELHERPRVNVKTFERDSTFTFTRNFS